MSEEVYDLDEDVWGGLDDPEPDEEKLHVYTNGCEHIVGTSLREALEAYEREIGIIAADETCDIAVIALEAYRECSPDEILTIRGEGKKIEQKTIAEWIEWYRTVAARPQSRCLCSIEAF